MCIRDRAYFLQFSRLYLYAVFVGFGFTLMELLYPYTREPLNAILAYGLPGTLVTAFGLIMLARFMSKYPPHKEPDNAQPQAGKD